MENINEIVEVNNFFNDINQEKINNEINETKIFQIMEKNFEYFSVLTNQRNGYLQKLLLISFCLRNSQKSSLVVSQEFIPSAFKELKETYLCVLVNESYNSDIINLKPTILKKYKEIINDVEVLKKDGENNLNTLENEFRFQSIWQQKDCIVSLFKKILIELNNNLRNTINLTSLIVYEISLMSVTDTSKMIFFDDLYAAKNIHDKWFSALDISVKVNKPIELISSNYLH